jgi:hypothetical protein
VGWFKYRTINGAVSKWVSAQQALRHYLLYAMNGAA